MERKTTFYVYDSEMAIGFMFTGNKFTREACKVFKVLGLQFFFLTISK